LFLEGEEEEGVALSVPRDGRRCALLPLNGFKQSEAVLFGLGDGGLDLGFREDLPGEAEGISPVDVARGDFGSW
jgi:hypothetical protein